MKTLQMPLIALVTVVLVTGVSYAEQIAESKGASDQDVSSSIEADTLDSIAVPDSGDSDEIESSDSSTTALSDSVVSTTSDEEANDLDRKVDGAKDDGLEIEESDGPAKLSVPPMDFLTYPEDRPDWLNDEPDLKNGTHRWVVVTKGWASKKRAAAELEALLPVTIETYLDETLPSSEAWIFCSPEWIEENLVANRYAGTLQQGDQTLHEMAVELKIDRQMQRYFKRLQESEVVDVRLKTTGGYFAAGFAALCCLGGVVNFLNRRFHSAAN